MIFTSLILFGKIPLAIVRKNAENNPVLDKHSYARGDANCIGYFVLKAI